MKWFSGHFLFGRCSLSLTGLWSSWWGLAVRLSNLEVWQTSTLTSLSSTTTSNASSWLASLLYPAVRIRKVSPVQEILIYLASGMSCSFLTSVLVVDKLYLSMKVTASRHFIKFLCDQLCSNFATGSLRCHRLSSVSSVHKVSLWLTAVAGIRCCLASLESVENYLVPAVKAFHLSLASSNSRHFVKFLCDHWQDEVAALQLHLYDVIDSRALVCVSHLVKHYGFKT